MKFLWLTWFITVPFLCVWTQVLNSLHMKITRIFGVWNEPYRRTHELQSAFANIGGRECFWCSDVGNVSILFSPFTSTFLFDSQSKDYTKMIFFGGISEFARMVAFWLQKVLTWLFYLCWNKNHFGWCLSTFLWIHMLSRLAQMEGFLV